MAFLPHALHPPHNVDLLPTRPPTAHLGSGAPPYRRRSGPIPGAAPPSRRRTTVPSSPHHPPVAAPSPDSPPTPAAHSPPGAAPNTRHRYPPPGRTIPPTGLLKPSKPMLLCDLILLSRSLICNRPLGWSLLILCPPSQQMFNEVRRKSTHQGSRFLSVQSYGLLCFLLHEFHGTCNRMG
ncbi:neural Wiskott-Aldrich syndrome protein-like isoform X6 [Panicum virgatum]|uniref:Uncharacterized protein n=1 Tax=Panicum virgatum TaxID=38727 RepID=A0A8T0R8K1_PANVG|nr:neural Wiskott-Aldrich syndrome protein-like isoform X6 [Panicum virgatum]KAG2582071.1 hypothetical protein PVAP13_6KG084200 [Panicum virgatum]KAG2582074.1 hypothetical protein PVAP13_6KG084200 [Panicum virgatum]